MHLRLAFPTSALEQLARCVLLNLGRRGVSTHFAVNEVRILTLVGKKSGFRRPARTATIATKRRLSSSLPAMRAAVWPQVSCGQRSAAASMHSQQPSPAGSRRSPPPSPAIRRCAPQGFWALVLAQLTHTHAPKGTISRHCDAIMARERKRGGPARARLWRAWARKGLRSAFAGERGKGAKGVSRKP